MYKQIEDGKFQSFLLTPIFSHVFNSTLNTYSCIFRYRKMEPAAADEKIERKEGIYFTTGAVKYFSLKILLLYSILKGSWNDS